MSPAARDGRLSDRTRFAYALRTSLTLRGPQLVRAQHPANTKTWQMTGPRVLRNLHESVRVTYNWTKAQAKGCYRVLIYSAVVRAHGPICSAYEDRIDPEKKTTYGLNTSRPSPIRSRTWKTQNCDAVLPMPITPGRFAGPLHMSASATFARAYANRTLLRGPLVRTVRVVLGGGVICPD